MSLSFCLLNNFRAFTKEFNSYGLCALNRFFILFDTFLLLLMKYLTSELPINYNVPSLVQTEYLKYASVDGYRRLQYLKKKWKIYKKNVEMNWGSMHLYTFMRIKKLFCCNFFVKAGRACCLFLAN